MSSATSIKRLPEQGAKLVRAETNGFRPSHFFILMSLLGATVAVVMARQPSPEQLILLSVIVGAAGLCGAALYATLVPLVRAADDGGRVPLSGRSRAALEREKMLALRSIKELEFDRAMGKMSPADFDELAGRLRARALALMKQLEASGPVYRPVIERELAARLEALPLPSAPPACVCGTTNDADAAFCKRCGKKLDSSETEYPEQGAKSPSESEREPSARGGGGAPAQQEGWGPASTEKR